MNSQTLYWLLDELGVNIIEPTPTGYRILGPLKPGEQHPRQPLGKRAKRRERGRQRQSKTLEY